VVVGARLGEVKQMAQALEVYKLDCYRCARTVEVPAGKPRQPE
jgi:hypothetical protein